MKQVALIGGSFDPVHNGHLALAHAALDQLNADEVWLIPTRQTPLKNRDLTSIGHRLAMLRRAIENEDKIKICDVDLKRNGPSYSVDTLEILHKNFPDCQFTWLIGTDQAAQFDKWKDPERLQQLAKFVVAPRNGEPIKENPCHLEVMDWDAVDVSSTEIRHGKKLNLMPEGVRQYILDHELYVYFWVKPQMRDHRFAHSASVARVCRQIAKAHHLDEHKAFLAGLFHDIAKDMDKKEMQKWMEACFPRALDEHSAIWHGYVGSQVAERIYGIYDPVITNAIANHVKGTSYDPYAMIVFVADKLDPLRGYDSSALLEVCMNDLYNGFMLVKAENKAFLEREKQING